MKTFFLLISLVRMLWPIVLEAPAMNNVPGQPSQTDNRSVVAYSNPERNFGLEYAKNLKADLDENVSEFGIFFHEEDGPGLFSLRIQKTPFSSTYDWVKAQNKTRPGKAKISIKKETVRDMNLFLTLEIPVSVDLDPSGNTVYADQKNVIMIKDHLLYQFTHREQWDDEISNAEFDNVVQSFHFLSP